MKNRSHITLLTTSKDKPYMYCHDLVSDLRQKKPGPRFGKNTKQGVSTIKKILHKNISVA